MQLAAHELQDLHELVLACTNSIATMGLFINHARDPELKAMLMRHQVLHIAAYDKKVAYLRQQWEDARVPLVAPILNATLNSYNLTTADPAPPLTPRTGAQTLNDREIAAAYLLDLKRSGREYAWATMEMSHPELRLFLEESFRLCSHHAYEVWQYMAARGLYPVRPAPDRALQDVAGMYNPVVEGAPAAYTQDFAPQMGLIPPLTMPQTIDPPQPDAGR